MVFDVVVDVGLETIKHQAQGSILLGESEWPGGIGYVMTGEGMERNKASGIL